uniref:Uncharacterized protein n=1 Tax=Heterorhabditis bacteriophora TaxID=37862 RepID=A0A1I7XBT0_HETBA
MEDDATIGKHFEQDVVMKAIKKRISTTQRRNETVPNIIHRVTIRSLTVHDGRCTSGEKRTENCEIICFDQGNPVCDEDGVTHETSQWQNEDDAYTSSESTSNSVTLRESKELLKGKSFDSLTKTTPNFQERTSMKSVVIGIDGAPTTRHIKNDIFHYERTVKAGAETKISYEKSMESGFDGSMGLKESFEQYSNRKPMKIDIPTTNKSMITSELKNPSLNTIENTTNEELPLYMSYSTNENYSDSQLGEYEGVKGIAQSNVKLERRGTTFLKIENKFFT